jgi:tetratricopeptide (TPR) repeat protein
MTEDHLTPDDQPHGEEPGSRPHIARLSQQGYQLLRENYIPEAEKLFRRILDYDEQNNYALVGLGDAERKRGDCRSAVQYYNRCLDHHPENNYALFGLADCYKNMRQYHRAIEVWERYLNHDDENVTVLTRVADAHRKVRNFERSKELYERVLTIEENNAYAIIGLAHLYYDFKDYETALYYWNWMLRLSGPQVDIRVLTSIGNCYRKLKRFETAVQFFEQALEREPKNFYALFGLGDCYRGLGRPESALEYWNRILGRDPKNKLILTRAADAYRAIGDGHTAERYYRSALDLEFDVYAVLGLALLDMDRGEYAAAAESLEGLLPSAPKNPRVYEALAECYLELDRRSDAIELLESFPQQGKRNRRIADMLARIRAGGPARS